MAVASAVLHIQALSQQRDPSFIQLQSMVSCNGLRILLGEFKPTTKIFLSSSAGVSVQSPSILDLRHHHHSAAMSDYIPSLETPPAQPKIMSAFRKYGRYDDFKPLSPSITSLGSKYIGKIYIDCQFLFQKSKWGTLRGLPGGIMYVNLNFGPPSGCRVSNATITITLDGDHPCLEPYIARRPREEPHVRNIPIRMTEWYGPQSMGGEKKSAEYASTMKAVPEANILSYGVGGVGRETTKTFKKEARWSLNGQLLPGERTPVYKSLRWNLNENELEGQSFHNPTFRTAFAFEHSGQPFVISVEIEGNLAKLRHQIKSKLKFDAARGGKVVTLVDFEDHRRFSRGLDLIAKNLPFMMREENLELVPKEIPDSMPSTTVQQLPSGTPQRPPGATLDSLATNDSEAVGSSQQPLDKSSSRPMLRSSEQSPRKRGFTTDPRQGERPFPREEDYRMMVAALSHQIIQPLDGDPAHTTESITRTVVDVRHASEDLDRAQEASAPTAIRADLAEKPRGQIDNILRREVDRDVILTILSILIIMVTMMYVSPADG